MMKPNPLMGALQKKIGEGQQKGRIKPDQFDIGVEADRKRYETILNDPDKYVVLDAQPHFNSRTSSYVVYVIYRKFDND